MRWKWLGVIGALFGLITIPAFTWAAAAGPALTVRSTIAVARGVTYTSYLDSSPRNVINVTEISAGAQIVIKAVAASSNVRSTALVTTMCHQAGAAVCINGDFFTAAGALGGELVNGQWVKLPISSHQQLWLNGANQFDLGARPAGAVQSLGATGYAILSPGKPISIPEHDGFADGAYARTLVGWDGAGDRFFVTVEQGSGSAGMSLAQAAGLMRQLGATNAVNDDGGGSSQMVVNGVRYAAPGEWARPVANAWAVALVGTTATAPPLAAGGAGGSGGSGGAGAKPTTTAPAPALPSSGAHSPANQLQSLP